MTERTGKQETVVSRETSKCIVNLKWALIIHNVQTKNKYLGIK